MSYTQYEFMNFKGGLHNAIKPYSIAENEASFITNVDFTEEDRLDKRAGTKINSNFFNQDNFAINQIIVYRKRDGSAYNITLCGSSYNFGLLRTNGVSYNLSFRNTAKATIAMSGKKFAYVIFKDNLYLINSVDGLFKFTGVPETGAYYADQITTVPKCDIALVYRGRVFYSGDPLNPDRVYFSGAMDAETVSTIVFDSVHTGVAPTTTGGGGLINVMTDTLPVTGLEVFANKLVIFKADSIFAVSGYEETAYRLAEIDSSNGCISPGSIVKADNGIYFRSRDGIRLMFTPFMDTIQTKLVSEKVRFTNGIADRAVFAGYHNRKYFLFYPSETYVYDEKFSAWTRYSLAMNCCFTDNYDDLFYFANNNGYVYGFEKTYLKDEVKPNQFAAISGEYSTGFSALNQAQLIKRLREIMLFFAPQPQATTLTVKVEIGGQTFTRTFDITGTGLVWGVGKWGDPWLKDIQMKTKTARLAGDGHYVRVTFTNSNIDQNMGVNGFILSYIKNKNPRP